MFTIKGVKNLGKTRVLWQNAPTASPTASPATQESPDDLIRNAKTAHEKGDRKAFEENLAKLTKINDQTKDKLLSQIDSQMGSDDDRSGVLVAFYNAVKGDYDRIADAYQKNGQGVIVDTRANTFAISESIKGINTRSEQAESFLKMLQKDKTLSGFAEKFGFAKTQLGEDVTNKSNNTFGQVFLEHNSLAGIANHVLYGVPYTTDGTFGPNEKPSIANFITEYNKLTDSQKKSVNNLLRQVSLANLSGLTSIEAASVSTMKQDQSYYSYLIEGSNSYKSETAKGLPTLLKTILGNISEKDMPKALIRALKIGGYEGDIPKDEASLKKLLSADAGAKLAIIAGIVHAARHGGGEGALLSKNMLEMADSSRKLLDYMNTPEGKNKFKEGLNNAIDANVERLIKELQADNSTANDEKIKALQEYQTSMKNDTTLFDFHFQGYSAYITNASAGAGVSWGSHLDTIVADSVSLGIGIDSATKKPMVGLSFSKEVVPNNALIYGVSAGGLYVGSIHRFDAGYNVSWMKSKLGASVTVSKDMQKNQQILDATANIQTDKEILSAITSMAKDPSTKVENIDFAGKVPPNLITNNAQNSLDQPSYTAINKQITASIRTYLNESTFDNETNPLIREALIREAMRRAIQDRVDAVKFDISGGGWSLSQLGVTLGMFAGAKFILPYISFEREDISMSIVRTETQRKEIRKDNLDFQTLFETPIFEKDGTYKIKLKDKDSIPRGGKLPEGALWNNDDKGYYIEGLSKFGLKFTKYPNGKIDIEYDTTKPIQDTKTSVQDKAAVGTVGVAESLELNTDIRKLLGNQRVRVQLSDLLVTNSPQKTQMQAWANAMNQYEKTQTGDFGILKIQLLDILRARKNFTGLTALAKTLESITEGKALVAALYDIRGASMMDYEQAKNGINNPHTPANGEKSTLARWNEILKKLPGPIPKEAFNNVVPETYTKAGNKISEPIPNMIGAVASLKTGTPEYHIMPAGTMRLAGDGEGKLFSKPITDLTAKGQIFDTVLPENSRSEKTLRANIAAKLGKDVSYNDLKNLLTTGSSTIGNRKVEMKGTQFALCAYGDCTNAAMGIIPGSISAPATNREEGIQSVPISGEQQTEHTTTERRTELRMQDHAVNLLMSFGIVKKPEDTITTKPGQLTTVTTKPGESTIYVNGKPTGVVNTTNNTITLVGHGTFRLAPGQTITQFLGQNGQVIPPITQIQVAPPNEGILWVTINGRITKCEYVPESLISYKS